MKLSELGKLADDPDAQWFVYDSGEMVDAPVPGEFCVKVNPAACRRIQRVQRRFAAKRRGEAKNGKFEGETLDALVFEMTSSGALAEWAGIEGDDGKSVPCESEWIKRVIEGPAPEFLDDIADFSAKVRAKLDEQTEDDEGNSLDGSEPK